MTVHQLVLKETSGINRATNPILIGIPLPQGKHFNQHCLVLCDQKKKNYFANIKVTALWPDNSIKWCLVNADIPLQSNEEILLSVAQKNNHSPNILSYKNCITEAESHIEVHTKNLVFNLDKKIFGQFNCSKKNEHMLFFKNTCELKAGKISAEPVIEKFSYQHQRNALTNHATELNYEGSWLFKDKASKIKFEASLIFFHESDTVKCTLTLHNSKTAFHEGGLWDLGDPNSFFFNSLSMNSIIHEPGMVSYQIDPNQDWKILDNHNLTLFQISSGGDNWNSPNHKNKDNEIPLTKRGYECRSNKNLLATGDRAFPLFKVQTSHGSLTTIIDKFWQNFPKAMSYDKDMLTLDVFPDLGQEQHELQPGEKKTHNLYFSFSDIPSSLAWITDPIDCTLNPDWVNKCKVYPFSLTQLHNKTLQAIINLGLDGNESFFCKREALDEYGWRHFGDLYADHETEGYQGEHIFVSHYNNQYDPLYGFLRQYTLTGESRWLELANDLASHVTDIDIYHTKEDKLEYNQGLFWHTDHYLDAGTSTHRSYSKHHPTNAYEGHAGGGGPGGQHCYTTGLLYHYLLTGSESSKKAVFNLLEWIQLFYDGDGTLSYIFLSLKNYRDQNYKNIFTNLYPLDRGTGNYLNALLDCYYISQEDTTLNKAANIIQQTVHPLDDISERGLDNVEEKWFYLIFLQAVCRFLRVKEECAAFDSDFYYARDALLQYTDWMAKNEYPYLEKPDILEFPNYTWTAQDIRKANIFYCAAYYSPDDGTRYLEKAEFFKGIVIDTLSQTSTRKYTRILSILMQNREPLSSVTAINKAIPARDIGHYKPRPNGPFIKFINISKAIVISAAQLNIKKEKSFLISKSQFLKRLLS